MISESAPCRVCGAEIRSMFTHCEGCAVDPIESIRAEMDRINAQCLLADDVVTVRLERSALEALVQIADENETLRDVLKIAGERITFVMDVGEPHEQAEWIDLANRIDAALHPKQEAA